MDWDDNDTVDFGGDDDLFGDNSTDSGSTFMSGGDDDFDSDFDTTDDTFDFDNADDTFNSGGTINQGDGGDSDGVPGGLGTKKTAIIAIAVGVVILLVVFIVGGNIAKSKNGTGTSTVQDQGQQAQGQGYNAGVSGQRADDIMSESKTATQPAPVQSNMGSVENNYWKSFSAADGISFSDSYSELQFTVTKIEHFVATTNDGIALKTVLTGSLSGMSGSYELVVPYSKGSRLTTGNVFAVQVQMGSYKGKTVIGDIKY